MKNLKKKGFTIVELVIVIAVVAILAAVLIPTFVNLTKKANMSSDQQAVRHMNTLLAMDETKPTNTDEVVEILIENGYKNDLTTYYDGYTLAWLATENKIVLVENNAVVWPKDYEGETVYTELKPMVKDVEELLESLTDGKTVFIAEDIIVEEVSAEASGVYTINLNGNTLTSSNSSGSWVDEGKLVVSNGTIDGSSIVSPADAKAVVIKARMGGIVELSNVQIYAPANANPIQCYGGTMVLNKVTVSQSGQNDKGYYNSAIQVVNGYGENANYDAHLTINGGMYSGKIALQLSLPGGTVIINDGIFNGVEAIHMDSNYNSYPGRDHSITINGGNFTGSIYAAVNSEIIINGGTFSINPETDITGGGTITITGEVIDNGNGTWTVKQ